jgi:hypothetical protein
MSAPARRDFASYGPQRAPNLVVEAKRMPRNDPAWATEWRRNVLENRSEELASVLLALVTLRSIFVWSPGAAPDAAPAHVFDVSAHLGRYFERTQLSPDSISPQGFEQLVGWWLRDLRDPERVRQLPSLLVQELEQSGILGALRDAELVEGESTPW